MTFFEKYKPRRWKKELNMIFEWIVVKKSMHLFWNIQVDAVYRFCGVVYIFGLFLSLCEESLSVKREEKSGLNIYRVHTRHTLLQYRYIITTRTTEEWCISYPYYSTFKPIVGFALHSVYIKQHTFVLYPSLALNKRGLSSFPFSYLMTRKPIIIAQNY